MVNYNSKAKDRPLRDLDGRWTLQPPSPQFEPDHPYSRSFCTYLENIWRAGWRTKPYMEPRGHMAQLARILLAKRTPDAVARSFKSEKNVQMSDRFSQMAKGMSASTAANYYHTDYLTTSARPKSGSRIFEFVLKHDGTEPGFDRKGSRGRRLAIYGLALFVLDAFPDISFILHAARYGRSNLTAMKKDAIAAQARHEAGETGPPDFRCDPMMWPLPTEADMPNWEFARLQAGLMEVEPHNRGNYYHYKIATADGYNIFVELNARSDRKRVYASDVRFEVRDRREGQIHNIWLRHAQAQMMVG